MTIKRMGSELKYKIIFFYWMVKLKKNNWKNGVER